MDRIDSLAQLRSLGERRGDAAPVDGATVTVVAEARSDSRAGRVTVAMPATTISEGGSVEVEAATTVAVRKGDSVQVSVANSSPVVTGVVGRGDEQQAAIDANASEVERAQGRIDEAEKATEQARKDASDAVARADALAGEVEEVKTTTDGLTTKVEGAVSKAEESLTLSTQTSQTVGEVRTTAQSAYTSAQDALTRSSEAVQTANSVKTTVETDYVSKADAQESYYSKSEVDQRDDSIKSSVTQVSETASDALAKASEVEQTADGLAVSVEAAAGEAAKALGRAGASNLVPGFCAPASRWARLDAAFVRSGSWDSVGAASGWAWFDADNTSGTSTKWVYLCDLPQAVEAGGGYTLLCEFQSVSATGSLSAYFGAQNSVLTSCFANSQSFVVPAGASERHLSLSAGTAAQVRAAETCTRGILALPAGAKASGRVRFSLYKGDYDGPYLSPGAQGTANGASEAAAALETLIRLSGNGVEVARKVNGSYTSTKTLMDDTGFSVLSDKGDVVARLASALITLLGGKLTIEATSTPWNGKTYNEATLEAPNGVFINTSAGAYRLGIRNYGAPGSNMEALVAAPGMRFMTAWSGGTSYGYVGMADVWLAMRNRAKTLYNGSGNNNGVRASFTLSDSIADWMVIGVFGRTDTGHSCSEFFYTHGEATRNCCLDATVWDANSKHVYSKGAELNFNGKSVTFVRGFQGCGATNYETAVSASQSFVYVTAVVGFFHK